MDLAQRQAAAGNQAAAQKTLMDLRPFLRAFLRVR
jgi:hypothetical protein